MVEEKAGFKGKEGVKKEKKKGRKGERDNQGENRNGGSRMVVFCTENMTRKTQPFDELSSILPLSLLTSPKN